MKTALLHYWLTNMRGGEKVLAALGEMLPEADIFTHAFGIGKYWRKYLANIIDVWVKF